MSLLQHLSARASHAPQITCLVDQTGAWTYARLWSRIEQLAQALSRLDARRVSSALDNGGDAIALDLALRLIGAVHLPLPGFFTDTQVAHAQSSAAVDVHVSQQKSPNSLAFGAGIYALPLVALYPSALPATTGLITYTSGSTGTPKGVCLSAAHLDQVSAAIVDALAGATPQRHLCLLPLSVLLEQVAGVGAALLANAVVVIPPLSETGLSGAAQLDPLQLANCIQKYQPESLILVPQMLQAWMYAIAQGASAPASLRFCAVGGARVGSKLLAQAEQLKLPVFEGYGLSECGSVVCLNRPGAQRSGTVGQALPHVRVRRAENAEILVEGERFLGYVGGTVAAAGPYRTGDLGDIDSQGFVSINGRLGSLFITAFGRNVSPEWVESELTQHPLIRQALVQGEARAYNCAVIVPSRVDTSDGALQTAINEVNRGLPDYARVTRFIRAAEAFTPNNQLLTSNGRLRRAAVLSRYASAIDQIYSNAN